MKRCAGTIALCVWLTTAASGLAWAQSTAAPAAARATPDPRAREARVPPRDEVQDQRQPRQLSSRQLSPQERHQLREQIGEAQRQQQERQERQEQRGGGHSREGRGRGR